MKIDGHCHCGKIFFEAEVDRDQGFSICHCTDCQILTGSAFRTTLHVSGDKFSLKGTPKVYIKTAESGNKRAQAFCGDCGSHIYASDLENPSTYSVRTGIISQRMDLFPFRQIWRRSALPWVNSIGSVPAKEKG